MQPRGSLHTQYIMRESRKVVEDTHVTADMISGGVIHAGTRNEWMKRDATKKNNLPEVG